jgi:methyl-accepting chemotaxis protein
MDGSTRAHGVFPITNDAGEPVGVVYGVDNLSKQADDARGSMYGAIAVVAITLLITTFLISGMIDRLVFRRLTRMVTSIEDISVRVAGGDFDAQFEPDGTTDEIGEFEAFFAQFMELVSSTLRSLMGGKDDPS